MVKKSCLQCRRPWVQSLGREDPLEKEMAPPSSTLAWRIPWTEKSGGLQSMGLQRVRHDWVTNTLHLGEAATMERTWAILLEGEDTWRERPWRTRQNESREAADRWGKPSWIFQPSWLFSWMLFLKGRSQCPMKESSHWVQPRFLTQRDMNGNTCLGTFLVLQWLRLCTPNAGDPSSSSGQGTRLYMPLTKIRVPACHN